MEPLIRCYSKHPDFVPRTIAGEHILVPLRRTPGQPDALYVLNGTGGFIWEQLSETTPVAAVCDRVSAQFDVAPEQAARDVTALLQQLESIGAIQPSTTSTA